MARALKTPPMKPSTPTHDEISARAYQIFVERGCPEGRDLEHWLEAEKQLSAASQPSTPQPQAATPSAKSNKSAARQTANRRM
jgi:hypothetical protein